MNLISNLAIPSRPRVNPSACLALVFGILVFTGCGRKPVAAVAPATPAPTETAVAPAAENRPAYVPPTAPVTVVASPDGGADLKQLNHAYIGWIVQTHQRPKSYEAFIAASGMQVPPAPAGKKYVIDKSGFINLVPQ